MTKRLLIIATFLLLIAATVSAQRAPGPQAPDAARPQAILVAYLQLTPDQIASWKQIGETTAAAVKPLAENVRTLEQQLKTAVEAAVPDPLAIGNLVVQIHTTRDQIRTLEESARTQRLAVLTPEQKTKFDAFNAALAFLEATRGKR